MSIVYDEEGQFDVSDDGAFANSLEEEADVSLVLEKLTERQKIIAQAILCGKTQREIAEELGTTQSAISETYRLIIKKLKGDIAKG